MQNKEHLLEEQCLHQAAQSFNNVRMPHHTEQTSSRTGSSSRCNVMQFRRVQAQQLQQLNQKAKIDNYRDSHELLPPHNIYKGFHSSLLADNVSSSQFYNNNCMNQQSRVSFQQQQQQQHVSNLNNHVVTKNGCKSNSGISNSSPTPENLFFCTHANILFADIVNFSMASENIPCEEMVMWLQRLYSIADTLASRFNVEINKMIGDCFMFTTGVFDYSSCESMSNCTAKPMVLDQDSGSQSSMEEEACYDEYEMNHNHENHQQEEELKPPLPNKSSCNFCNKNHNNEGLNQHRFNNTTRFTSSTEEDLVRLALFAMEFRKQVASVMYPQTKDAVKLRMGMHCGKVMCGVMGRNQMLFDIWSCTVNIASRMESLGIVDRIQCTEDVYAILKEHFPLEKRGQIMVKGKGIMQTFLM